MWQIAEYVREERRHILANEMSQAEAERRASMMNEVLGKDEVWFVAERDDADHEAERRPYRVWSKYYANDLDFIEFEALLFD